MMVIAVSVGAVFKRTGSGLLACAVKNRTYKTETVASPSHSSRSSPTKQAMRPFSHGATIEPLNEHVRLSSLQRASK